MGLPRPGRAFSAALFLSISTPGRRVVRVECGPLRRVPPWKESSGRRARGLHVRHPRAAAAITLPAWLRGRVPSRRVLVGMLALHNLTRGARVPHITGYRAPNSWSTRSRLRMQGCQGERRALRTRSARVPRSASHLIAHDTLLTATRTSRRQASFCYHRGAHAAVSDPWLPCRHGSEDGIVYGGGSPWFNFKRYIG